MHAAQYYYVSKLFYLLQELFSILNIVEALCSIPLGNFSVRTLVLFEFV